MFFPVSTLPFTTQAAGKVTHFKYDYNYYFTAVSIDSSNVNKWRKN